jgi:amino acid transporter
MAPRDPGVDSHDHEFIALAGDDPDRDDADSVTGLEPQGLLIPSPTYARQGRGKLTRLNGLALVISLQIGSGIFTAPSQVSQHVSTPGQGLLVWLLGGLLVWTGAASFIELGLRIPRNGGIQEYLQTVYGDVGGFLFTWTWTVIAKPSANAVIASIFASYVLGGAVASPLVLKAVALLCVWAVTFVNCLGATAGANAANLFLVLKLCALGAIIVLGSVTWVLGYGDGVPSTESGWFGNSPDQGEIPAWTWMGNFATALFGALFCYGGWETVSQCLRPRPESMSSHRKDINVARWAS